MKMHFLPAGRLRMHKGWYLPNAERSERIELPVWSALMRHSQGNVLFDTGCHPSTLTDAAGRWGGLAQVMVPIGQPEENVIHQLAAVGLQPDDIDVVINSHLHSDHCGCNEYFKRATLMCHADELAAASGAEAQQRGYLPVDWTPPTPFETVEGTSDLFGDGRIVMLPLPGHSAGMMAALVALDRDGDFVLASDAAPLRVSLEQEIPQRFNWDVDATLRSYAEIRRMQNGGATVIFGHDDQQWRALRKGVHAYE
jgi:N-acyl homoserine lactone hydrolase